MISPETIIQVYNILKSFKEAYDQYASQVEECEITLRMLNQLMEDRQRVSTLNPQSGIGKELRGVFDQLKRCVLEFDISVNGAEEEESSLESWEAPAGADGGNKSLKKKMLATGKSFARNAFTSVMAQGKADAIKSLTDRLKNILTMVDLETNTAQARSLAIMSGQGATELMTNTVDAAKTFWTTNFLSRMEVPVPTFLHALAVEVGETLQLFLGDQQDQFLRGLCSLLDSNGDGNVDVREYAKLVDVSKFPREDMPKTLMDILISQVTTFSGISRRTLSNALLGGHVDRVDSIVKLSHQFFASTDASGDVKVWSRTSLGHGLELLASLRVSFRVVTAIGLLDKPVPNAIVLGTQDGDLNMYDIFSKLGIGSLPPQDAPISCIKSAPGQPLLFVTTAKSNSITVHNAETKKIDCVLNGHSAAVVSLEILTINTRKTDDGNHAVVHFLASGATDGVVRLWDIRTLAQTHRFSVGPRDRVVKLVCFSIAHAPSEQVLFVWHRKQVGSKQKQYVTGYHIKVTKTAVTHQQRTASVVDPTVFTLSRTVTNADGATESVTDTFSRGKLGRSLTVDDNQKIVDFDVSSDRLLFQVQKVGKPNKKSLDSVLVWAPVWMLEEAVEGGDAEGEEEEEGDNEAAGGETNEGAEGEKPKEEDGEDNAAEEAEENEAAEQEEYEEEEGMDEPAYTTKLNDDESICMSVKLSKRCKAPNRLSSETDISATAMIDHYVVWADVNGSISRFSSLASSQTCHKNHELTLAVRIANKSETLFCDICRKLEPSGVTMNCSIGECSFDACLSCWKAGRSFDECQAVATQCYLAHGTCPRCKDDGKKLERIKMLDKPPEEEQCSLCGETLKGTNAFHCPVCGYLCCMTCRKKGLIDEEDQAVVSKQQVEKSRTAIDQETADEIIASASLKEGTSSSGNHRSKLVVFGGSGIWAGHSQSRSRFAALVSGFTFFKGPMSLAVVPRGGFVTALGGRTIHKWGNDGRLLATEHILKPDNSEVMGGWSLVTKPDALKLVGQYPVQPLDDVLFESGAPAVTVMFTHERQKPKRQLYTVVGTDVGHLGIFDVNGRLLHKYQLLARSGRKENVCGMCLKRPLSTFSSRLANTCSECLKATPNRTISLSVHRLKGVWAWIPPRGAMSCLPGFNAWRRVFIHIREVGAVSYLAASDDDASSSIMEKIPLCSASVVKEATLKYLIAKGSPDVCVCGISIVTPHSDATKSLVEKMPLSNNGGGVIVDRWIVAFENHNDFEEAFLAVGNGSPLIETAPCIKCLRNVKSAFSRQRFSAVASDDGMAQPPAIRRIPATHYFCEECTRDEVESQRVIVTSIACNEHSVFAGVKPVGWDNANPYIIQLPFELENGPIGRGEESICTLWNGQPQSICCIKDYVVFATGSQNPAVLIAESPDPKTPIRSSIVADLCDDTFDDDSEEGADGQRGASIVSGVTCGSTSYLFSVSSSKILLWKEVIDADGAKSFEQVDTLVWSRNSSCITVSAMQVEPRDTCIHIFVGFNEGGVVVWSFDTSRAHVDMKPCAELLGHSDSISSLKLIDTRLITASTDNTVHFWPVSALGLTSSRKAKADDEALNFEPVDPTQWDWDWTLTRFSSKALAVAFKSNHTSKPGDASRETLSVKDDDLPWFAQFYNVFRDLNLMGSYPPFFCATLGSWVQLTVDPESHRWVVTTMPPPQDSLSNDLSGTYPKETLALLKDSFVPEYYSVSGKIPCFIGTRAHLPLDSTSGEEGFVAYDQNTTLSSGDACTLLLSDAGGCAYMECSDRPLELTLSIIGTRSSKRGKPLILGIGLLNLKKKENDESTDEDQAWLMKKIQSNAGGGFTGENGIVYVSLTGQEESIRVSIAAPWYVPCNWWGELIIVNVTTFPSKVWLNVDAQPPTLDCAMTEDVPVVIPPVAKDGARSSVQTPATCEAKLTSLDDVDEDDRDDYRIAQFGRFECPVCHELPPEVSHHATNNITLDFSSSNNSVLSPNSAMLAGLTIAAHRRCPNHPTVFCFEPHLNSSCPLCYTQLHQMNRRNCYMCGRAVCNQCCYVRRTLQPVPAEIRQAYQLDDRQEWPVCIMCDLDPSTKETLIQVSKSVCF